jgi:hypothetical protein
LVTETGRSRLDGAGVEPWEWAGGGSAAVSIDADFFSDPEEQRLVTPLVRWLVSRVRAGVPVDVREDHVDYHQSIRTSVDLTINFDFHMDMRIDFLFGAPPAEPADPTVFESVLATGATRDYVWAHPVGRRQTVADVYTAALLADRQPLLRRIHGLPGADALGLLDEVEVAWVFVCRSPGYATADTDAAFQRLRDAAERQS